MKIETTQSGFLYAAFRSRALDGTGGFIVLGRTADGALHWLSYTGSIDGPLDEAAVNRDMANAYADPVDGEAMRERLVEAARFAADS